MSNNDTVIEPCVSCGESTAFGSGRFVNRVPGDHVDPDTGEHRDGFWCVECQSVECDRCGASTVEFSVSDDGDFVCDDCDSV